MFFAILRYKVLADKIIVLWFWSMGVNLGTYGGVIKQMSRISELIDRQRQEGEISRAHFLSFDFEMTGLDPDSDSIIEIGAVPLHGSAIDGDFFFSLVRPYTNVRPTSKKIHGIDGNALKTAPSAEHIFPEFVKLARGRILLGQKPQLDLDFLWSAAKNVGMYVDNTFALDLSRLYTIAFPQKDFTSLDAMAKQVGLSPRENYHNALDDAILTAKIFGKILPLLQKRGIIDLRALISRGRVGF